MVTKTSTSRLKTDRKPETKQDQKSNAEQERETNTRAKGQTNMPGLNSLNTLHTWVL